MKKILMLTIAIASLFAFAGMATAADIVEGSGTIGGGSGTSLNVVTSSNVRITYNGTNQGYGAVGEHRAGNRAYGTASGTPGIFYKIKTAGDWSGESIDSSFTGGGEWTAQ